MGRRPNQVVNTFFERGRKIADSSNRYEHTCKRCGELYPKGRVNILLNHILRQCKRATSQDREVVDHYLRHPEEHALIQAYGPVVDEQQPIARTVDLPANAPVAPLTTQPSQSALDTLAEASRQHLNHRVERQHTPVREEGLSLMAQLQQAAYDRDNSNLKTESSRISADRIAYNNAYWLQSPGRNRYNHNYMPAPQPGFHEVPNVTTPQYDEPESQEAIAEQYSSPMHDDSTPFDSPAPPEGDFTMEDRQAQAVLDTFVDAGSPASWHAFEEHVVEPQDARMTAVVTTPHPTPQRQTPATVHPNVMPQTTATMQTIIGTKARNKFTVERRQQVLDTRRRGACLRCRMLKKPCSDGDPCSACSQVEAARLWQGTCVRTRLVETFTLWSTNLFHSHGRLKVPAAVQGFTQLRLPGRMEARFFPFTNICLTFACKQWHQAPGIHEKADLSMEGQDGLKNVWLVDEGTSMAERVQVYVRAVADACIEQEPSAFLKATLRQAQLFSPVEEAGSDLSTNTTRSGYKLHAQLLQDVVELWVLTQILALSDSRRLDLQYNPTRAPQHEPEQVSWDRHGPGSAVQPVNRSSHAHSLVLLQLLAVIENRASALSKAILNEMEKRFLQRKQMSRFGTFLVAVLLLNCVERMAGLYRTYDDDSKNLDGRPPDWPLDKLPGQLWSQGDHFAHLLILLLRLRGLPPRTFIFSSGVLGVVQDLKRRGTEQGQIADLSAACDWLDPLRLSVNDLKVKANGPTPDADDKPQEWDLRYISRLLLPQP